MADDRDAYRVLQVDPEAHETVIRVAYRALAALYHPDRDQSALATHRMAELNLAYDKVRTRDRREAYDRLRKLARDAPSESVIPATTRATTASAHAGHAASPRQAASHGQRHDPAKAGPEMIDFGRYAGWTIKQLARHDPDYLRWLGRHSSGIRYRRVIEEALQAATPPPPAAQAGKGRGRRR